MYQCKLLTGFETEEDHQMIILEFGYVSKLLSQMLYDLSFRKFGFYQVHIQTAHILLKKRQYYCLSMK